jgi:predicted acylesterase/phospholipase RssA
VAGKERPVSEPFPRPVSCAPLPSLSDLQADGALLSRLPLDALLDLRARLGHLAIDLDIAISRQMAPHVQQRQRESEPDRLISAEVAATRFGVKRRWLLDHAGEIPGVKRLSRKTIRFSERKLARFLDRSTA